MQPLLLVLIAIITYVYISYYYRYPSNVKVLSAYDDNFNTALMLEKQPIVVVDSFKTIQEFKNANVPYLLSVQRTHDVNIWLTNNTKYLFIKTDVESEIHLLPASKKLVNGSPSVDETLITLQIKPSQLIILPFKWHYYSDNKLSLLGIHDYISWAIL